MRLSHRGALLLLCSASLLMISPPGGSQSVGSGGVTQVLAIYDTIDLGAFANSVAESTPYLNQQLLNGKRVTELRFWRFATSQAGPRAYLGGFVLEPTTPPALVDQMNYFYIYTAVLPFPAMPPDRMKAYFNQIPAIHGPVLVASPVLLDFLNQVLAAPPAQVTGFLSTRTLVGIQTNQANSPSPGGLRLAAEFTFQSPGTLPVVVTVESDCVSGPGGTVTCGPWMITVN